MGSMNNDRVHAISQNKTWLFVPATRIDRVDKAFTSGADAVIVDLEDTVAPEDKATARAALKDYYDHQHHNQTRDQESTQDYRSIWVRINKAGSEAFFKDIVLCQKMPHLAGVVLAKAEKAEDINSVHQVTSLPVIALIESAVGLYQIDSMAKAVGLVAFSYGFLDLCNDLQVQVGTAAADVIANQIRYQLILTSTVHQLSPPIDTIYADFDDEIGLSARVQLWSQMGLSGMLCIHPKQVAVVQQALHPTDEALSFAKRVVDEYERNGQAVFKIEGEMVDAPVIERSRQLLNQFLAE